MNLPSVTFVDAPPDSSRGKKHRDVRGWVAFVLGILSQHPGKWALVVFDDDRRVNVSNIQSTCEGLNIKAEVVIRRGMLYMRVTP